MKAYWENGGIAQRILDLGTDGGVWSASRSGRFTPRKRAPFYPLYRRLDEPQSRSRHGGEE
jgi:hypothetical protein